MNPRCGSTPIYNGCDASFKGVDTLMKHCKSTRVYENRND